MEAVGSSEMLETIYKNQQSLIVTPAFTHASLSAHSHVKCVLKWSKPHIMHYTATITTTTNTSHTQIKDANNCVKNFTHISFLFSTFNGTDITCIIFLHYWCLITKPIIPLGHILSAICIYGWFSQFYKHYFNYSLSQHPISAEKSDISAKNHTQI